MTESNNVTFFPSNGNFLPSIEPFRPPFLKKSTLDYPPTINSSKKFSFTARLIEKCKKDKNDIIFADLQSIQTERSDKQKKNSGTRIILPSLATENEPENARTSRKITSTAVKGPLKIALQEKSFNENKKTSPKNIFSPRAASPRKELSPKSLTSPKNTTRRERSLSDEIHFFRLTQLGPRGNYTRQFQEFLKLSDTYSIASEEEQKLLISDLRKEAEALRKEADRLYNVLKGLLMAVDNIHQIPREKEEIGQFSKVLIKQIQFLDFGLSFPHLDKGFVSLRRDYFYFGHNHAHFARAYVESRYLNMPTIWMKTGSGKSFEYFCGYTSPGRDWMVCSASYRGAMWKNTTTGKYSIDKQQGSEWMEINLHKPLPIWKDQKTGEYACSVSVLGADWQELQEMEILQLLADAGKNVETFHHAGLENTLKKAVDDALTSPSSSRKLPMVKETVDQLRVAQDTLKRRQLMQMHLDAKFAKLSVDWDRAPNATTLKVARPGTTRETIACGKKKSPMELPSFSQVKDYVTRMGGVEAFIDCKMCLEDLLAFYKFINAHRFSVKENNKEAQWSLATCSQLKQAILTILSTTKKEDAQSKMRHSIKFAPEVALDGKIYEIRNKQVKYETFNRHLLKIQKRSAILTFEDLTAMEKIENCGKQIVRAFERELWRDWSRQIEKETAKLLQEEMQGLLDIEDSMETIQKVAEERVMNTMGQVYPMLVYTFDEILNKLADEVEAGILNKKIIIEGMLLEIEQSIWRKEDALAVEEQMSDDLIMEGIQLLKEIFENPHLRITLEGFFLKQEVVKQ